MHHLMVVLLLLKVLDLLLQLTLCGNEVGRLLVLLLLLLNRWRWGVVEVLLLLLLWAQAVWMMSVWMAVMHGRRIAVGIVATVAVAYELWWWWLLVLRLLLLWRHTVVHVSATATATAAAAATVATVRWHCLNRELAVVAIVFLVFDGNV